MTTATRARDSIATTEPTRYEVALMRGSEVVHVYGFTARKSREGLWNAIAGQDITALLTPAELKETETFQLGYSKKNGIQVATGLAVRFTGRTEREAAH